MRILLGLSEVSGFFSRLESGFTELGVHAVHISLHAHRFGYTTKKSEFKLVHWARWAVTKRLQANDISKFRGQLWLPQVIISRMTLFIWCLFKFDVFILGAGSSFFGMRELPLLRLLGKTIIYTLHGTDARPPYVDGYFEPWQYGLGTTSDTVSEPDKLLQKARQNASALAIVTKKRLKLVQQIERNAHFIFCAPSYAQFLSRPFVNFYAIGLPTLLPKGFAPSTRQPNNSSLRLLHAPSNMEGKGTKQIRKIIKRLQDRGLPIEYNEISGRPNTEVFDAIYDSDIVIDQLYSDTPLAGFPSEAGMLGKPAVVGGYFSMMATDEITPAHTPPSAFCQPEDMEETIAQLVNTPEYRDRLGSQVSEFINNRWTPGKVAARILQVIDSDIPHEWIIEPDSLRYILGCGISKEQARANVSVLIETYGIGVLGLGHKPVLQQLYATFAKERHM